MSELLLSSFNGLENGDEDDVFQCGKCKEQFSVISQFMAHKQEHANDTAGNKKIVKHEQSSGIEPRVGCTPAGEQIQLQVHSLDPSELGQQVILNDSDILSFNIDQNALITSSSSQMLTDIDPEVTYITPGIQAPADSCVNTLEMSQPIILTASPLQANSFLMPELQNNKTAPVKLRPLKAKGNGSYDSLEPTPLFANAYKGCRLILSKLQANVVYNATAVESVQRAIFLNDKILSGKVLYTETSADNQHLFDFEDPKTAVKDEVCMQTLCTTEFGGSKAQLVSDNSCQEPQVQYPVTVSLAGDAQSIVTVPSEPSIILSVGGAEAGLLQKPAEPCGTEGQDDTPAASNSGEDSAHQKKTELKCDVCNKVFKKNFDLKQHIRSHTGEKPFQCVVCGRAFSQKSNVKKHMSTHKVWPRGMPQTLPKNPLRISSESSRDKRDTSSDEQVWSHGVPQTLPNNSLRISSEKNSDRQDTSSDDQISETTGKGNAVVDKSYMCQYCSTVFSTYFALKTHLKEHSNEKVYKCIQKNCNKMFTDLEAFVCHTEEHTAEVQYRCHVCSSVFKTLDEVGIHQYVHNTHKRTEKRGTSRYHRCLKCKSKFSTPEALDYHLATCSHSFPCSYCEKVFLCERNLRRHLHTHATGTYKCEKCGKEFRTESYYNSHQLVHTGEKPFKCLYCPSAFVRKDKLMRHSLIHESTKKFKCPFRTYLGCMREFHRQDKLKLHLLTHSVRNYCRKCKKSFSSKLSLMQHQDRLQHWTRPPSCSGCGEKFSSSSSQQSHKCPASSKIFSRGSRLQSRCRRKPREKRMQRVKQKLQDNVCAEDGSELEGNSVSENVPTIEIIVFPVDTNNSQQNHGLQHVVFPVEQNAKDDDTVLIRTEANNE